MRPQITQKVANRLPQRSLLQELRGMKPQITYIKANFPRG